MVAQVGAARYIDEQFATPRFSLATVLRELTEVVDAFYVNALTGADQLRQRVIGALSEIFVISRSKNNTSSSEVIPWLSLLSWNAFGNYRTLLTRDHARRVDGEVPRPGQQRRVGRRAEREYPRELMELFNSACTC